MPRLSSQRYAGSQFATLLTTPLPVPRRHPPYRSNLNQYIGHVEKRQLETCPEYDKGHFIGFESHGYSPVCAWEHLKVTFFISRTVDSPRICGEHGQQTSEFLAQRGTIPACAGSTSWAVSAVASSRDHPCMRGEHVYELAGIEQSQKSSCVRGHPARRAQSRSRCSPPRTGPRILAGTGILGLGRVLGRAALSARLAGFSCHVRTSSCVPGGGGPRLSPGSVPVG